MKKYTILLALILLSCKDQKSNTVDHQQSESFPFYWLSGSWYRVNNAADEFTYENWYPMIKDSNFIHGVGYTLQDGDTIFKEELKIKKTKTDSWILEVSNVNETPTLFKIDSITDSSFTAVNLKNMFPTHIYYEKKSDTLFARVSNEDHRIDFKFLEKN